MKKQTSKPLSRHWLISLLILKKHIADYLLEQLNAQADTLVETTKHDLSCLDCGHERPVKWGRSYRLKRYRCGNRACRKTFNVSYGNTFGQATQLR